MRVTNSSCECLKMEYEIQNSPRDFFFLEGGGKIFPWKSIPWLHFREKTSLEKEKLALKCKQRTVTTIHDNNVYLI